MSQSKADKISEAQSNLPLPEQPPREPDWNVADNTTKIPNSSDARYIKVGSGAEESGVSTGAGETAGLREPSTKGSGVREEDGADLSGVGREGKENLEGLPKDALAK